MLFYEMNRGMLFLAYGMRLAIAIYCSSSPSPLYGDHGVHFMQTLFLLQIGSTGDMEVRLQPNSMYLAVSDEGQWE